MYCPNCASSIDGTQKFCRACGANVSLVPQAMTGQLPVTPADEEVTRHGKRRHHSPPSIEKAAGKFFSGIGFLIAAFAVLFRMPGGWSWGWAFLFPAFALLGEGIGQYLKVKELERQRQQAFNPLAPQTSFPQTTPSQSRAAELSAPTTSDLINPSSVTEHTTRHLEQQR